MFPTQVLPRRLALGLALIAISAFLILALAPSPSNASAITQPKDKQPTGGYEPLPPGATVETVLPDMLQPIAMAFDPAGRLFYTEKNTGNVRLFANGVLQADPVIHVAVDTKGEHGLLGIAVDPDFNSNHYIYVYYTCFLDPGRGCDSLENRVMRFVEDNGVGADRVTIFTSPQTAGNLVGGNLHFGPDSKLYITVGSNSDPEAAQDVSRPQGKIHRINRDGTIPTDNPVFTGTGALPSLYARGLRNSFDFAPDPYVRGRLFASENGHDCDDEMNRIEGGYNYGHRPGYPCDDETGPDPIYNTISPLWFLPLSFCCEAPTGITVYTGNIAQWHGDVFMATYNTGNLRHFYLNPARTAPVDIKILDGVVANMDVETGPDGALYYLQGGGYTNGTLKRIVGPPSTCTVAFEDVPQGSAFYSFVECMACRGIITGYPCGRPGEPCVPPSNNPYFRPASYVSRGQLSKIVNLAAGFSDPVGKQYFEDVQPGSAFYNYVQNLVARGYITGYPCGAPHEPCVPPNNLPYFRPADNASRGQIAKIVSNAAGLSDPAGSQIFEDVPPGSTFYDYAQRLASRGSITGYPCGGPNEPCVPPDNRPYFRPADFASRGQTSKIVANTFFPGCVNP